MAGPVFYYIARLFCPKIPGTMVAQNGAWCQAFSKAAQPIPVCFILHLIGGVVPMDQNIAAAGIASARIIWACGFFLMNPVRCKSDHIITIQPGAKRVTIAAIYTTELRQIFRRAAHHFNAININ